MEKYMIDKFMRVVQLDREAFNLFVEDRQGFVDNWTSVEDEDEGRPTASKLPTTLYRGALSKEARDAFVALDITALYEAGAHPYMLWHFMVDVLTAGGHERGWIVNHYKSSLASSGHPDYST